LVAVRFGLKLWSTNYSLLDNANLLIENGIFHYVELMPIPHTDITPFLEYDFCYIIHATTEHHGFNIADKEKKEINAEIIDNCIRWADKLNAHYMIIHPGFGSLDTALSFLDCVHDKRILIENMPRVGLCDESMVGYTPEHINKLMGTTFGFCLDFGHAIKAAVSLSKDYKGYIDRFLMLEPKMFHISDGTYSNEKDEHLAVGEGDYDFAFLMNCVKKSESAFVTLETPRHSDTLDEDVKNVKKLNQWAISYPNI
jgi:endonuclease IV